MVETVEIGSCQDGSAGLAIESCAPIVEIDSSGCIQLLEGGNPGLGNGNFGGFPGFRSTWSSRAYT